MLTAVAGRSFEPKSAPAQGDAWLTNPNPRLTRVTVRATIARGWSSVIPAGSMPAFAHNVGVSGSATGVLDRDFVMVAYGAPYDLDPRYANDCKIAGAPHCWGYWDLYQQFLKITP